MDQLQLWAEEFPRRANKELDDPDDAGLYVIAGTGSRSVQTLPKEEKNDIFQQILRHLTRALDVHGDRLVVMSGMAEGLDKALAVAALSFGIKLWCAIPNDGYGEYYWGKNSRTGRSQMEAWHEVLDQAWRVTYVCDGVYVNGVHSNFIRNTFMKTHADFFFVLPKSTGGTADMMKKLGKNYPRIELEWP